MTRRRSLVRIQVRALAGWSSSVARRAHNPEVHGSNPCPATKLVGPGGEEEVCKTYADGFDSRGQLSHSMQPMVSMMRPLAVLFFGI